MTEFADSLLALMQQNPRTTLLIATGTVLTFLVIIIGLSVAIFRVSARQRQLFQGTNGQNLEQAVRDAIQAMQETRLHTDRALEMAQRNMEVLSQCLQRVGVVRFDAFDDVGGEQSFAVAVLDEQGNGILFTGIRSRQDMNVYAKPVIAHDSPVQLSAEERQAIGSARAATGVVRMSEAKKRIGWGRERGERTERVRQ
ncbi:MAG: DUF4446 family protein [Armatimonadaceae bacterium]